MAEPAAAALLALCLLRGDGEPLKNRFFPLPLYATLPNEGSTYGVMPVLMRVGANSGETRAIFAPSASWNKIVHVTGTYRGYHFFSDTRQLSLIASFSTKVNRSITFEYLERTRERGKMTTTLGVTGKQNVFYRFYGLGPLTTSSDESSYTRLFGRASIRQGYNLFDGFNIAAVVEFRADNPRRIGVPGLPLAQDRFPFVPGMSGAAIAVQGVSVSYDTRDGGDYALQGVATDLTITANEGIAGSDAFARLVWHTRGMIPETSWLQGAARLYIEREFGGTIPFLYQSALGGDMLLRGFPENRFTDRGAWTIDVEQRFRVLRTHLFGITADWRADLFAAVGQVYDSLGDVFDKVRPSGGVGFRVHVPPNVLGRIDVAYAGEGVQAYVVLGSPF